MRSAKKPRARRRFAFSEVQLLASATNRVEASTSGASNDDDILAQFVAFRRLVIDDRHALLGASPSAFHDIADEWRERSRLSRLALSSSGIFATLAADDLVRKCASRSPPPHLRRLQTTLATFEWTTQWLTIERLRITVDKYGRELRVCETISAAAPRRSPCLQRVYNCDGSHVALAAIDEHWSCVRPLFRDEAAFARFLALQRSANEKAALEIAFSIAIARLEDRDWAALAILILTRPASQQVASEMAARQLASMRNQTLEALHRDAIKKAKIAHERVARIVEIVFELQVNRRQIEHPPPYRDRSFRASFD